MSDDADEIDIKDLSPAELARLNDLASQHPQVKAFSMGGRTWFLRRPKRAEWLKFKTDSNSQDPATQVRAGELLARVCLLPANPAHDVKAERDAFDAMGEEYPALPDLLGMMCVGMAAGPHKASEKKAPSSSDSPNANRE